MAPPAATFREEMAARGGFQTAPTGGGGGAMGPGPPVPGAGPGMGPGTPSGRMGPSSAAQNHMYRSPMPGPGYPVRYHSIFAADALASPLEQSLLPLLCHRRLTFATDTGAGHSSQLAGSPAEKSAPVKNVSTASHFERLSEFVCCLNLLTLPPANVKVS